MDFFLYYPFSFHTFEGLVPFQLLLFTVWSLGNLIVYRRLRYLILALLGLICLVVIF